MRVEWHKVTWYSKIAALIVFTALPFAGFSLGMKYETRIMSAELFPPIVHIKPGTPLLTVTSNGGPVPSPVFTSPIHREIAAPAYSEKALWGTTPDEPLTVTIKNAQTSDDLSSLSDPQLLASLTRKPSGDNVYVWINLERFVNDSDGALYTKPDEWLRLVDDMTGDMYAPKKIYAYYKAEARAVSPSENGPVIFIVPRSAQHHLSLQVMDANNLQTLIPLKGF